MYSMWSPILGFYAHFHAPPPSHRALRAIPAPRADPGLGRRRGHELQGPRQRNAPELPVHLRRSLVSGEPPSPVAEKWRRARGPAHAPKTRSDMPIIETVGVDREPKQQGLIQTMVNLRSTIILRVKARQMLNSPIPSHTKNKKELKRGDVPFGFAWVTLGCLEAFGFHIPAQNELNFWPPGQNPQLKAPMRKVSKIRMFSKNGEYVSLTFVGKNYRFCPSSVPSRIDHRPLTKTHSKAQPLASMAEGPF